MDQQRIKYLLEKFSRDELVGDEAEEFLTLVSNAPESFLPDVFEDLDRIPHGRISENRWDRIVDSIVSVDKQERVPQRRNRSLSLYQWISAVAAIILIISFSVKLFLDNSKGAGPASATTTRDVQPGSNKAVLTLGDGKKIILDDSQIGLISKGGTTEVIKKRDGQLQINASALGSAGTSSMMEVSTPRGGTYQVILPDQSVVWLNAASTIRFPSVFSKSERLVEIDGEAYFEIKKAYHQGRRIPFRVKSGVQTVEVLGTHFNINAYKEEGVLKTTLLEGSVRVHTGAGSKLLKPGQQSVIGPKGAVEIYETDTEEAVAWKNSAFLFNELEINEVMRQVARWYDIQVVFEDSLPEEHYNGYISRNVPISNVLKMLEETGDLTFRINNGTVYIKAKKKR
ncbi:FecR family protein [Desertivirga brevis]|uniref:FecR family protein n=1 Tax=Desertivirga brevis TaxID=2810310 RepID=UPI001A95CF42|nr:FecR family protein [Pedobacter sp. SYSU D00873]